MDVTLDLAKRLGATEFVNQSLLFLVSLRGILTCIVLTQALLQVVYKARELFFCPVNFLKHKVLLSCFK